MSETHKEQISSLLDDELDSIETSELIKALESDQGLNKQFDRYALIRDALNEDVVVHQESFLKSVQEALVVEPTVLAPRSEKRKNNSYVAVALAASVAIFSVVIFDIGSFNNTPAPLQSVASLEAQVDEMLALEEQRNADMLQGEPTSDVQFVTFEK
ncbi:MAG TPA: anti-sigma 24 factor [Cycloclasticus sp.]|jgi:sigma-E factor negative regulatory protein RseA|nr:anti-sigma 24 factor [Cycloclasticus sp.]HIL91542.1 anti-sigma 24 factor [Cycloclasticus sp.]